MKIDPRTKLLILAITSISVFLNGSITIECIFAALPFLLLLSTKKIYTALKYAALFLVLLAIQFWLVPLLPVSAGGIIYMFAVYIRKLIPCFMLGSLLISTTRVSEFLAAVGKLRLPKGFTISLSITLRYFPTMGKNGIRLRMQWLCGDTCNSRRDSPPSYADDGVYLCPHAGICF